MAETSEPGSGFHYNRDERVGKREFRSEGERTKGKVFARNRSLLIILLDIVLVLVIFGLYRFILVPRLATTNYEGYELRLRAFEFEDEILVSLRVRAGAEEPNPVEAELIFQVAPGGPEQSIERLFPSAAEGEQTYRVRFPSSEEASRVEVQVRTEDREFQLQTELVRD